MSKQDLLDLRSRLAALESMLEEMKLLLNKGVENNA